MYPVVLWLHFVGLTMWLGTILTVQPGSELSKSLFTWKWTGFAGACLAGFLLLSADATAYVTNTGFRLKLGVLTPLALVWHLVVRTKTAAIGRWAGAIEFLLWLSVVAASVGFLLTNAT